MPSRTTATSLHCKRHDAAMKAAGAALLLLASSLHAQPLPMLGGVEVPGYAHASAAATGPIASHAAGAAELAPDGAIRRAMTADTPVRIASISKLVVALAIARLADAGKLSLDDDAGRHLGWPLRNPAHPDAAISIRMLLRHSSGLSDAGGYSIPLGQTLQSHLGPASWSKAAPGTAFDYANIGFPVLAQIIERITGERFDRAARSLVLDPLGVDACFNWSGCTPETIARGAVLYRKAPSSDGPWNAAGPWFAQVDAVRPAACPVRAAADGNCALDAYVPGTNGGLFGPQGGLRISVVDLAKIGQALLQTDGRFLKPQTLDMLFTPRATEQAGQGEETDLRLMQYWSEGGLHCFSGTGQNGGDQPLAPKPMAGCGHLGEAYGLRSALIIDRAAGRVNAHAFTGTSQIPPAGKVSRFSETEEALFALAN